ncbi:hypothetical protein A2982_02380 [candidate division WWE3 bacterium RIFCSPLOWO2_01_FULL_39_13]|uniref:Uncharacterized protein n=1 Tax=candidate division WWE3 bacterium RIFCSPLOWO2_01_FULL_39_13 TaxID=1802624 RepID=A0A1F4V1R2_UNCKA|nr:MAG: hypothetical protein A2982_02380 [candidate division WWE3 bacterium RIFCSPLOWO2_01_FULL_39_13]
MNSKTIAVDFDGVIHKYSEGWKDGSIYDDAVEGAFEKLDLLVKCGFHIIIHTTRMDVDAIHEWIKKKQDETSTSWGYKVAGQKPEALAYIDDRGIRFTNWNDMVKYFI